MLFFPCALCPEPSSPFSLPRHLLHPHIIQIKSSGTARTTWQKLYLRAEAVNKIFTIFGPFLTSVADFHDRGRHKVRSKSQFPEFILHPVDIGDPRFDIFLVFQLIIKYLDCHLMG